MQTEKIKRRKKALRNLSFSALEEATSADKTDKDCPGRQEENKMAIFQGNLRKIVFHRGIKDKQVED